MHGFAILSLNHPNDGKRNYFFHMYFNLSITSSFLKHSYFYLFKRYLSLSFKSKQQMSLHDPIKIHQATVNIKSTVKLNFYTNHGKILLVYTKHSL